MTIDVPALMSHLRKKDLIVRREECRKTGMTFGPYEVRQVTACGASMVKPPMFVVDYQLNQNYRLLLCRETVAVNDVLAGRADNSCAVVMGRYKPGATLDVMTGETGLSVIGWTELDADWLMLKRTEPRLPGQKRAVADPGALQGHSDEVSP